MARRRHGRARRVGGVLAILALAVLGVGAGLVFFSSRDRADVSDQAAGPGQALPDRGHEHLRPGEKPRVRYASDPPTSGPHVPRAIRHDASTLGDDALLQALEQGNVVLLYGEPRPPEPLRSLARDVNQGAFSPDLAASGQAVILGRRPGTRGVVALAWRHLLRASGPRDPALRAFADAWLGRGAG